MIAPIGAQQTILRDIQRLMQELRRRGWVDASVARALGVRRNTYCRWATGQRVPQSAGNLAQALWGLLEQEPQGRKKRIKRVKEAE